MNDHVLDAARQLRRLLVGSQVPDGRRVEDRDVGERTFLEQTAVLQVLALSRQGCDLADRLFQGKQLQIACVVPEKTRHAPISARMSVGREERTVERFLVGVEPDACPRLLQTILQVSFVGDEEQRAGLRLRGDDEIDERVDAVFVLVGGVIRESLTRILLQVRRVLANDGQDAGRATAAQV